MIRSSKVPDIWKKVNKNSYQYYLETINLNGVLGISEPINFKKGLFAICGLNGVGKSTLFTAVKDILGIQVNNTDKLKLNNVQISANLKRGQENLVISNSENARLTDIIDDEIVLSDIDFNKLVEVNRFIAQPNFEELIEQYDENVFDVRDIRKLNYLVGKTYDAITMREIEVADEIVIPYFQVKCNDLEYDSLKMGTGEHFLFYVYWMFKRINRNGILLIEEPEVFISVNSQINLMNFIAEKMNEHKFSVILVTHSPFILKNIERDRLLILYNYLDSIHVIKPEAKEQVLQDLGLAIEKKGVLIFEDRLALDFFKSICRKNDLYYLNCYELEIANGFAGITKILSIPKLKSMSYKMIGLYDGDMRGNSELKFESLNWEYLFLPGEVSLEEEFQNLVRYNFDLILEKLGIEEREFKILLAKIQGMEDHDWLIEVAKMSRMEFSAVVDCFYEVWVLENQHQVDDFLQELNKLT